MLIIDHCRDVHPEITKIWFIVVNYFTSFLKSINNWSSISDEVSPYPAQAEPEVRLNDLLNLNSDSDKLIYNLFQKWLL